MKIADFIKPGGDVERVEKGLVRFDEGCFVLQNRPFFWYDGVEIIGNIYAPNMHI